MICPDCRAEVTAGGRFCGNCGAPLASTSAVWATTKRHCPKCGALTSGDKQFCGGCGCRIHPEEAVTLNDKQASVAFESSSQAQHESTISGSSGTGVAAQAPQKEELHKNSNERVVNAIDALETRARRFAGRKIFALWLALVAFASCFGIATYIFLSTARPTGIPKEPTPPVTKSIISRPVPATPGRGTSPRSDFDSFYAQLRSAIHRRDQIALRELMAPRFEWALDGYTTREQALDNVGRIIGWPAFWDSASLAVARPAQPCKPHYCNNRTGYETFTKAPFPLEMLFERGPDNQWYWAAVLGD